LRGTALYRFRRGRERGGEVIDMEKTFWEIVEELEGCDKDEVR
jgi:hypothetical protein